MHEYGHHHDHDHCHDHEHCHDHDHEHCHEHNHACQGSCGCESCAQDPKAELVALMNYMVKHNTAHCAELEGLGKQLQALGMEQAHEQVLLAVSDFEKGNLRLSTILASMK